MATLTKTFSFAADAQGWAASTVRSGLTIAWAGGAGNPAGCLQFDQTTAAGGFCWAGYRGTWESLGVPAGSTVTAIRLANVDDQVGLKGTQGTAGDYEFYSDNAGSIGSLQADLLVGRNATTNESSWTTRSGTVKAVPSAFQASATVVWLTAEATLGQGANPGTERLQVDNLSYEITYSPPPGTATGSGALARSHPTLAGTAHAARAYHGSAAVVRSHPLLTATGHAVDPNRHGSAALARSHPVIAGVGAKGLIFRGSGSLARPHPAMSSAVNHFRQTAHAWVGLVIVGGGEPIHAPCPLSLVNTQGPTASDWCPTTIQGDGVWPGFAPAEATVDVVIGRGPEAGVALTLVNKDAGGSCSLAITGHPGASGSATVAVTGTDGSVSGSAPLAMPNVAVPSTTSGSATLALPNNYGSASINQSLAISGWASS